MDTEMIKTTTVAMRMVVMMMTMMEVMVTMTVTITVTMVIMDIMAIFKVIMMKKAYIWKTPPVVIKIFKNFLITKILPAACLRNTKKMENATIIKSSSVNYRI